ncbi:hypothetical protein [Brevibacillus sp. NRS-1366]|uniref:hypothetical protein n=1 Tax=Brevibacillus sp. NRS-1366 TaxID=3233899 RepID=UPI003D1DBCD0
MGRKYDDEQYDISPFNSVTDHAQRIQGLSNKRVNLAQLPKWLRFFWYAIAGAVFVGGIFLMIALLFSGK